ncbi:MAG: heavy metal translocating P-type ATPase [Pseudomonadota bacterium]
MTCCGTQAQPDNASIRSRLERERLLAASHGADETTVQSDFLVPAMHCVGCIRAIETGLARLPGVINVRANLSTRRVSVRWRPEDNGPSDFVGALADLGFEADLFDLANLKDEGDPVGRRLLLSLAVAGFAAANIMLLSVSVWSGATAETADLFHLISGVIAVPAVLYAGRPFFASALSALRAARLNMDVPISLAVLLALGISIAESLTGGKAAYFDAAVTLLFFLLIGRYLDHMMRQRARGAVTRLSRMIPSGATLVLPDGTLSYRPLGDIQPGNEIVVAAGERVPLDGRVKKGKSDLDRSLVTGESEPTLAGPGLDVEAGILNLTAPLRIGVTRVAKESFIAEIMQMMEAAEQSKSRYVRIADRVARIYAPVVHLLAAISFIGWMIGTGGDWRTSLFVAISVLIITCPCALALAVPIAQVVAANRLFRAGIPVKDGAALEKLKEIDTVVFDKTGTLTLGQLRVAAVSGGSPRDRDIAMALAGGSVHPAARAIADTGKVPAAMKLVDISEQAGFGMQARHEGKIARLGRRSWVAEIAATGETSAAPGDDGSEVCFAREGGPIMRFALADTLRSDAGETVARLAGGGLDTWILSGDTAGAVAPVAARLDIAKWRAGLTPHEKIACIEALQEEGHKVLFVGDGLNDAPALAAAHVSIAPASGSDIGRLSADLVLTGKTLGALDTAVRVAHQTGRIVRQNLGLAVVYNCIAIPIAVSGHASPLVAAIAMSASSILVVANSFRLNLGPDRSPLPDMRPALPANAPSGGLRREQAGVA